MKVFPSLAPRRYQPWHGLLFLVVLLLAVVLGIVQYVTRDKDVQSNVPSLTWADITPNGQNTITEEPADGTQGIAVGEPNPATPSTETPTPESDPIEEKPLPDSFNLAVPFTSQAPQGVWDELHEDACEEASVYMVAEYFAGAGDVKIDPATADRVITALVYKGEQEFAHGLSVTAAQTVELVEAYYSDFTAEIIENPSVEDLKRLLADGYPVIVPALGRELGNPNFSGEGPLYHMLVLRGYDATHFITNDPGTRLGQGYQYTYDVLMSAIADWNNGDPVNGTARVVVIRPAK